VNIEVTQTDHGGYWTDDPDDLDVHVMKHIGTPGGSIVVYSLFESEAPRNPKLRTECVDGIA
jgi:hypothetical protein